jgi:hypothetical protein
MSRRVGHRVLGAALAVAAAGLLSGCAAADKLAVMSSTETSSTAGASMAAMHMSTSSTTTTTSTATAMAGMDMGAGGAGATGSVEVAGTNGKIKPVPTQILGTTTWEGMKITAQAMTAVPFVVYDGTHEQTVKPRHTSFHLMVMLSDADTGVPIPYATVWATIKKAGQVVFDERQWPMISRYMGPHYGNDVTLPSAGDYELSLLVSPPVSARHVEYANVWLKPHRVHFTFPWTPSS